MKKIKIIWNLMVIYILIAFFMAFWGIEAPYKSQDQKGKSPFQWLININSKGYENKQKVIEKSEKNEKENQVNYELPNNNSIKQSDFEARKKKMQIEYEERVKQNKADFDARVERNKAESEARFNENVKASQTEFDARVKQNKEDFEARKQKMQVEYEERVKQNKADFDERVKRNKAESEARFNENVKAMDAAKK